MRGEGAWDDMYFWIASLGLAAIAAALLGTSLLRGRQSATPEDRADQRIYRDQLREVDREVARGVLAASEAERARTEIARRMLEADRASRAAGETTAAPRAVTVAAVVATALFVVGGSTWIYTRIGAPGYPDLPREARVAMAEELRMNREGQAEIEERLDFPPHSPDVDPDYLALVERLRTVVAERPTDAQGLTLLARSEAGIGNYAAAHLAQARLIDLRGDSASARDYADLADMLILAAGGYVSPEAEAALTEALKRDPRNGTARYYTGLLFAQIDRPDLAFSFWRALLTEGPPDAPWIEPIRVQIPEIAMLAGERNFALPPESGTAPGPLDVAPDMSPDEQRAMIRGMVEGLSSRLATEGGTATEWARLIHAFGVLGESERAQPILAEARMHFADDPDALAEIEAAARGVGLAE
jgi:cytochrome c-type biogenesis protein CcmH